MTNKEIARLLRHVAAAYTIRNDNRFKIIAYEKAADSIEHLTTEIKDLWSAGKLSTIPGIGASIASHLDELFKKGKVKHFEQIFATVPKSVFPLLDLAGFGAKKAYKLVDKLNIKNSESAINELEKAGQSGKIAEIDGFGGKSQEDILEAIESYKKGRVKEKRMALPYASAMAEDIISYLKKNSAVIKVTPLGSLRRMVATIGDIDIAVATDKGEDVIKWFIAYDKKKKLVEKGKEGATILIENDQQIDLRVIKPKAWGSMLQYFTGSKHHNIHLREFALKKGLSLNEYGIKNVKTSKLTEFAIEEDFYHFLKLDWVPPEIREDTGEIEAAYTHHLPKLVTIDDVKGDLQIHSNFPIEPSHDLGKSSMEEILQKAKQLNYEYVAFTEHNPSVANHSVKQIIDIMARRKNRIEQLISKNKSVRVLNLLEVDILADGKLSLPQEAFVYVDAVLVSIHSSFDQSKEQMTNRILKGLSHPKAKILAHPTARLINQREGISADFDKIFKFCSQNNKAIEINAYPNRLDLPDSLVREAKSFKVMFSLGTDSHEKEGMNLMRYGVAVARRGWLTKDDILNTMEYNKLYQWLTEK